MAEDTAKVEVHRGLQGVYFDRSRVCFIDGRAGDPYRGYSIHDLAERSTFEKPAILLASYPRAPSSRRSMPSSNPRAPCRRGSSTSSAR
jgi:citrate synthase